MDKARNDNAWNILMTLLAFALLTGALIGVYGWLLGSIFAVFVIVAYFLVELRIIG